MVENESLTKIFQKLRLNNGNRLIIGVIKIISLKNKFEIFKDGIKWNLDILLISETKLE